METIICPECGVENEPKSPVCARCHTSLRGTAARTPEDGEQPGASSADLSILGGPASIPVVKKAEVPVEPQWTPPPPSDYAPKPEPQPPIPSPVVSSYSPPRDVAAYRSDEGVNWRAITLVTLLMACATFCAWWFLIRAPGPEETLTRYFNASASGDMDRVRPYLTKASLDLIDAVGSDKVKKTAPVSITNPNWKIVATAYEGQYKEKAVLQCQPDGPFDPSTTITLEFVLVKEQRRWKVDLPETGNRIARIFYQLAAKRGLPVKGQ